MNLLLVEPSQIEADGKLRVMGRQHTHIVNTLRSKVGDALTIGQRNGNIGTGKIISIDGEQTVIDACFDRTPPPPLPLKLIIALPRPKMLRRIIQSAVALGAKDIVFINSWKVEKSYWQSPWLKDSSLEENAILGLEQAKDTLMPRISLEPLFKPFVEDRLAEFSKDTRRLVAHPSGEEVCPVGLNAPCTLAIGPEGGFTPYEIDKLGEQGFECVTMGPRILRVETAVTALVSRLFS